MCEKLDLKETFSIFIKFHYCAVHLKKNINSYHHIPSCYFCNEKVLKSFHNSDFQAFHNIQFFKALWKEFFNTPSIQGFSIISEHSFFKALWKEYTFFNTPITPNRKQYFTHFWGFIHMYCHFRTSTSKWNILSESCYCCMQSRNNNSCETEYLTLKCWSWVFQYSNIQGFSILLITFIKFS